ncbi:MAG: sugar kinase [Alphaproteobacteria bacterium]|nr:sugar kinase [Alphaproteobacteria bacterium]MDP6811976.1 sugar kinase [Alphaproteobacteria bacterium]
MSAGIKIAAIGECMIELSQRDDGAMSLAYGGDTLNTAVYLARLCAGGEHTVDYLTALGDDPYSAEMLAFWRREGIGTDLVARLPGRLPGLHTIRTDQRGERSFHYWRSAAAAREMLRGEAGQRLAEALPGYDLIYLSGISLSILDDAGRDRLIDGLDTARGAGARVAFDSNYRPGGWADAATAGAVMDRLLRRADIALPSLDDERALHGDIGADRAARRIAGLEVGEICIKDGAGDCLIWQDGKTTRVAAEPGITPVDTTAAGDSFNAAYLHRRLSGADPTAAARAGHRLAGAVIGHRGAVLPASAMPAMDV